MYLTKSLLFFILIICGVSLNSYAKELCISYAGEQELVVSLSQAEIDLEKRSLNALESFLDAASGRKGDVLQQFTKFDGSQEYVKKQLRDMPDTYSLYSGIKQHKLNKAFHWGNYVVMLVDYSHERGDAALLESSFCTNVCQTSNVFDRPEFPEDLVSRYIYMYRNYKKNFSVCDIEKPSFVVMPSTSPTKEKPLKVKFAPPFIGTNVKNIFTNEWNGSKKEAEDCHSIATKMNKPLELSETKVESIISEFLGKCTINMNLQSLTPNVAVSHSLERIFLSPQSLISDFEAATQAKLLFQFNDNSHLVSIYRLTKGSGASQIIVLPMLVNKDKKLFDWKYFGTAAGEMLTSQYFAEYAMSYER